MINAKELRIGNRIADRGGRFVRVTSASLRSIECLQNLSGYERIPLTPEILEKCALGPDGYFEPALNFGINSIGEFFYESFYTGVTIKYLHQLQNLYFAITGKELQVAL